MKQSGFSSHGGHIKCHQKSRLSCSPCAHEIEDEGNLHMWVLKGGALNGLDWRVYTSHLHHWWIYSHGRKFYWLCYLCV
ncbi:hypothetical protein L2E82_20647 [Cichorium intybus]|uniref:Uncharacterized protein n=1 Tax=Cichorium intybus TaxID=13427 RepID=A0ACB9DTM6_CICIN|nr:hypothetical protein L2E82_20647 [Cichorium intybus]